MKHTILLWLAGGLFVGGLVTGFMPVGVDCGSAFVAPGADGFVGEGCDVLRAGARRMPVLLFILAAATLGAALAATGSFAPGQPAPGLRIPDEDDGSAPQDAPGGMVTSAPEPGAPERSPADGTG